MNITDTDDVRWIMQQVHDKKIIISLGLNEGESGALIGADLTKLRHLMTKCNYLLRYWLLF